LLIYSPYGTRDIERQSRDRVCYPIKQGARHVLEHAARRAEEYRHVFSGYFDQGTVIVPVPGHAPRRHQYLWPAKAIAEAMIKRQLADRIVPMLHRVTAVRKAATSTDPRRVSRHLETLRAQPELVDATRILVLDDVVTSGATLFASVQLVRQSYPNANVQAFALIRRVDEISDTSQRCLAPRALNRAKVRFRDRHMAIRGRTRYRAGNLAQALSSA